MNPRLLTQILLMLLSQGIPFAVSPLVTDDADTVEAGKVAQRRHRRAGTEHTVINQ